MKPKTYTILFVVVFLLATIKAAPSKHLDICPDCLQTGCIYQQINNTCEGETDSDILKAVYFVCGQRGIKDSVTIDLIKANYNL